MTSAEQSKVLDDLFGNSIEWDEQQPHVGYIKCPGEDKHTHKTGRKDCRIYLDGVPTVFCLHQRCAEEVEELTSNVRGALKSAGFEMPKMSEAIRQKARDKHSFARTAERLHEAREDIFKRYAWSAKEIWTEGKDSVQMPTWGRTLSFFLERLFDAEDVIWIGNPMQSGPGYGDFFQSRDVWRSHKPNKSAQFVCPNPFKFGSVQRATHCLSAHKYFVIEGDDCHEDPDVNRDRCGAIFKWAMEQKPNLKLRAVVDAGNKSLHGWFDFDEDLYDWARGVLPGLGADPATMRLAQPVRLPGQKRDNGKEQRLLWISQ